METVTTLTGSTASGCEHTVHVIHWFLWQPWRHAVYWLGLGLIEEGFFHSIWCLSHPSKCPVKTCSYASANGGQKKQQQCNCATNTCHFIIPNTDPEPGLKQVHIVPKSVYVFKYKHKTGFI